MRAALAAAGVPAVIAGAAACSPRRARREWLRLLQAIERPSHAARVRAAALTCFVGWSAEQVATRRRRGVGGRRTCALHEWADVLRTARRGGAARARSPDASGSRRGCWPRPAGERALTDLRHVGELLHHDGDDASASASPRSTRGCSGASPRPTTRDDEDAAGGSSPTPMPSRS